MIKAIFLDFFKFLKTPTDQQLQINLKNKLLFILILLLFELIFTFLIIYPADDFVNSILKIKSERLTYAYQTVGFTIIFSIILIALIEEFMFRYILRYKKLHAKFFKREKWNKIFPFLVYFSSILFGFLHLSNYENSSFKFFLLSPLIIFTQLFGGLIIAFIRVRLNFLSAIIYHSSWNFLAAIVIPFIQLNIDGPYEVKKVNYEIKIDEKLFFDKKKPQLIQIDSSESKIFQFTSAQYSIQHLLDTLYSKDKYYVDDVIINIKLNSKNGISKDEFLKILKEKYEIE